MFITNNRASFHLWWKENLVKHQKVSKYYNHDCSYEQFKFQRSLLSSYYCSKSHHRWLNKVSWSNKGLWNCYFLITLLFEWTTFSEPLLFKDPYFIRSSYTFLQELLFQKMLSFRAGNFRMLTLFSQFHFLFIIKPTNIRVFLDSNYLRMHRVGAPLRKSFY